MKPGGLRYLPELVFNIIIIIDEVLKVGYKKGRYFLRFYFFISLFLFCWGICGF